FKELSVSDPSAQQYRSGLAFGLVAYLFWGLVPLYFAALGAFHVPAWEILAHRIAWSLPILLGLTLVVGGRADLGRVLASRKLVLVLLASASLLAVNWLIYIYASVTKRVTDASLGYYMLPLVNTAFATLVLKEKLRPAHYPALALIVIGVAIPCVAVGYLPWIAVALPVTFGLYGLVRKKVPVESLTGLTVEAILMLPPSLGFLVYLSVNDQNHLTPDNWSLNALIAFSGLVTVVPLLTYTLSLRRLPLLAISFIQFLSPTVQMLIAVFYLGEKERVTPENVAAFACVWAAVALFIFDAAYLARKRRVMLKPAPIGIPVRAALRG
ncbi:MAG: EamA family transporter RarD, partial [Gemmataceae bacterium]|nr:EamA family transporter RarD [Gemmataceae bacterium]